jgi:hypothetical protein
MAAPGSVVIVGPEHVLNFVEEDEGTGVSSQDALGQLEGTEPGSAIIGIPVPVLGCDLKEGSAQLLGEGSNQFRLTSPGGAIDQDVHATVGDAEGLAKIGDQHPEIGVQMGEVLNP